MAVLEGLGFHISKRVGRAVIDHRMIEDGDRIAVAVSGGKDSLTLLHILASRREFVPIRYDLVAVHVDFGFHPRQTQALISHFKRLKIAYRIVRSDVLKKTDPDQINCFWCAWNRRKAVFYAADSLQCNKVAFGHHKDDIAQTMLMNLFFHGEISTMCSRQEMFKGKIVIIRPLAYVDEALIKRFARQERFKTVSCRCPRADLSKRRTVERIIKDLAAICPEITTNILKSTGRIKKDYLG